MPLDDARIFHVNVNCRSLESSRHFYTDGLGLTEGFRTTPESAQPAASLGLDHGRWDASILLGANGFDGGAIDLLQWLEPAAGGAPPGRPEQCGYQRIGITVPDLDAAVGRLGRTGGSSWGPPFPVERPDGREAVVALATDPDGTAVELVAGSATRLAFVAVCCADLERSVAFYQALGFVLLARSVSRFDDGSRLHIEGPVASRVVVLRPAGGGDVVLQLVGFDTPVAVAVPHRSANTVGIWRTALLVGDLDAAAADLARVGVATLSPIGSLTLAPGLDVRLVCFRGPDGEVVELIENPPGASAP